MIVLGIETSCDETSIAIVRDGKEVIIENTYSQIETHAVFGGVVPEIAAREHCDKIDELIIKTIEESNLSWQDVDRIAVVNGPGLISSLLVGINAAKTLSWIKNIEIVSVNHLHAHICANNLSDCDLSPPFICLLASGGHTQIIKVETYNKMEIIGETLDDSAGEAFDKVARMLGLTYPGGPSIQRLSLKGNKTAFKLPKGKVSEYDFSFSGLKTAVLRLIQSLHEDYSKEDIAACFQETICSNLSEKILKAAKNFNYDKIVLAGGVAANTRLRELLNENKLQNTQIHAPKLKYCTDNGAMVAVAGFLCPQNFGLDFTAYSRY